MMKRAMLMNEKDSVATALENLAENDVVRIVLPSQEKVTELNVRQNVPFGHKLAIRVIAEGDMVIKYGEGIGRASTDIGTGEYVHIHNVTSNRMQLPDLWYRK
jgi:altronate dehydratase small subunit